MIRRRRSAAIPRSARGFTYVELLFAVAISGMISLAMMGLLDTASDASDEVVTRNTLNRDLRFAINRMVDMTRRSPRLLLPLVDNPATNWPENIREQTVPASAPVGDSSLASAVLAVALPRHIDLDKNASADADDDGDGRFDEDLAADNQSDASPGITLIDDDGDGSVDEGSGDDDDEDGSSNEDPVDGIDNDGDGSIDEDAPADSNNDGCAGRCGVDDDGDGSVDDGADTGDDDEQGTSGDDAHDPVVFHLVGTNLVERLPVPWDTNSDSTVNGLDFVESTIAGNVTRFRVERVTDSLSTELVVLTLELTDADSGETASQTTSVRVGGAL